jgi:hypothetical protein
MASSTDVWVHICHAPPFKLHLGLYLFEETEKAFLKSILRLVLPTLCHKRAYVSLVQISFILTCPALLCWSLRRNTTHCWCLSSTKKDRLRYSHKFILG